MKKNMFISWIIFGLSFFPAWALDQLVSYFGRWGDYDGVASFGFNLLSVVVYITTVCFIKSFIKIKERRLIVISAIGGLILSVSIVWGVLILYTNHIFGSMEENGKRWMLEFGLLFLTIPVICKGLQYLEKLYIYIKSTSVKGEENDKPSKDFRELRKYFLRTWAVLFLIYIPIFLCYYPGIFAYDATYQFQAFNDGWFNAHHPILHSMLMGYAYKIGLMMGSASIGFSFYTILQMLIISGSFAYVLLYLYQKNVPIMVRRIVLVWYMIFPAHQMMAISATKDVLCAAFFLMFVINLLKLLEDEGKANWKRYAFLITAGVLSCLFRNNMVYVILVSAVILPFIIRKKPMGRKICITFLGIFFLFQGINLLFPVCVNVIQPDIARETLSLPIQNIARVAAYRKDELSQDTWREITNYLDEGSIEFYNPFLSDPVKNYANETSLRHEPLGFVSLWINLGLKYPGQYIESFFSNTLAYWYPLNIPYYPEMTLQSRQQQITNGDPLVFHNYLPILSKVFGKIYSQDIREIPVLGFLHRSCTIVWMLFILLLGCIWKKQRENGILGVILFLYFGTCLLGPVVFFRYLYCILVSLPLFFKAE